MCYVFFQFIKGKEGNLFYWTGEKAQNGLYVGIVNNEWVVCVGIVNNEGVVRGCSK